MNDEKVFQLLVETNPVPDPDGLDSPVALSQLERRSPNMATSERISVEPPGTRTGRERRNRILIGAATAVVVLIAGLGTLAILDGDSDATDEPAVAVVLSAFEALNGGDVDAYLAGLTGGALEDEETHRAAEALSYANRTWELDDCRLTGMTSAGESLVVCESTQTDDFRGAGGIVETTTLRFIVTADDKIAGRTSLDGVPFSESEFAKFNSAFWSWLVNAHPVVFDEIGPPPNVTSGIPGVDWSEQGDPHEPDEMLIALEYVAEFVAQSDVYPIKP